MEKELSFEKVSGIWVVAIIVALLGQNVFFAFCVTFLIEIFTGLMWQPAGLRIFYGLFLGGTVFVAWRVWLLEENRCQKVILGAIVGVVVFSAGWFLMCKTLEAKTQENKTIKTALANSLANENWIIVGGTKMGRFSGPPIIQGENSGKRMVLPECADNGGPLTMIGDKVEFFERPDSACPVGYIVVGH